MKATPITLGAIMVLGLLLPLLAVPPVFADFNEKFTAYTAGTVSPGPWTYAATSNPYSSCLVGNVNSTSLAYPSKPDTYSIFVSSACYNYANTGTLSASVNATQTVVTLSWWQMITSVHGTGAATKSGYPSGLVVFKVVWDGNVQYTNDTSTITPTTTSPGGWYQKSIYINTVLGAHTLVFEIITAAGQPVSLYFTLDSISAKGANIINPSPNIFLTNPQTNSWFNIAGYPFSFLEVLYTNSLPVYYYNLTAPDFKASTTGASWLQLNVGTSYWVTLIPQAGGTTFYLYPPTTPVLTFTIAVQDLSKNFPAGTQIQIKQGPRIMESGYTDISDDFQAWLVPGPYTITLTNSLCTTNPPCTFSKTVNFPSINGATETIQILKLSVVNTCGLTCVVSYAVGFDPANTNVVVALNDTAGTASSVSDTLVKQNSSGTFKMASHSFAGTWGEFIDTFSCSTNQCNSTLASQLYVSLTYTDSAYGSASTNIPVSGGLLFKLATIPPALLGLNAIFPNTANWLAIGAYVVTIAVAAVFGAYSAKFGAVVEAFMVGALVWMQWLPLGGGAVLLLIAVAITAFVGFLEQGR